MTVCYIQVLTEIDSFYTSYVFHTVAVVIGCCTAEKGTMRGQSKLFRRTVDGKAVFSKISPSTRMVLQEAERLGVVWSVIPFTNIFTLSYAGVTVNFHHQVPPQTTSLAELSCSDKRITRNLIAHAGVRVNSGYVLLDSDGKHEMKAIFNALAKPIVVKPVNSAQGKNVHLEIQIFKQFTRAITSIRRSSPSVHILAEEHFRGAEYRILCNRERIISVIKRLPPQVIGDGERTVRELALEKSRSHRQHSSPALKPLALDKQTKMHLATQGLTIESVPTRGQKVLFQDHTLQAINRGGETVEVTDELHPSVWEIAMKTIEAIPGLAWAGIDFMCLDHRNQQTKNSYRIIEVNASPSLDWQQYPAVGTGKNVVREFLRVVLPALEIRSQSGLSLADSTLLRA